MDGKRENIIGHISHIYSTNFHQNRERTVYEELITVNDDLLLCDGTVETTETHF